MGAKLSSEQYSESILKLAVDYKTQRHFEFNRFEHLSLIRILDCQHQLTAFDESFHYGDARTMDDVKRRKLNEAFTNYSMSLDPPRKETTPINQLFYQYPRSKLSKSCPNMINPVWSEARRRTRTFALKLREPRYWDSPDSLNVVELTPPERSPSTDRIRLWLQRHIFGAFLDRQGNKQRELEMERDKKTRQGKDAARRAGK